MTLIEAVKTGRRFRRPGGVWTVEASTHYCFAVKDILADDWEVEVKHVTVSAVSLKNAADRATLACATEPSVWWFAELIRALGLED